MVENVDLEVESCTRYYLYKLWVKNSGRYYIGITCNPERRKTQHLSTIYSLLRPLKLRQRVSSCIPAHLVMAKCLVKHLNIIAIVPDIKKKILFKIIGEANSLNGILAFEEDTIKKFKYNNLNIQHA